MRDIETIDYRAAIGGGISENPTDDDTCHGRGGVKQYL
jgi:hypothetical protein